jgi:hypothetical protein
VCAIAASLAPTRSIPPIEPRDERALDALGAGAHRAGAVGVRLGRRNPCPPSDAGPEARPSGSPDLWIDRREAQPYRGCIEREAARRDLPAAVVAELIGLESGFRNVRNQGGPGGRAASSAGGLGQQLAGNPYLHGRSRFNAEVSIAATAEEFAARLSAAHGDLARAADGYGVTARMAPAQRKVKLKALQRAFARG